MIARSKVRDAHSPCSQQLDPSRVVLSETALTDVMPMDQFPHAPTVPTFTAVSNRRANTRLLSLKSGQFCRANGTCDRPIFQSLRRRLPVAVVHHIKIVGLLSNCDRTCTFQF